MDLGFHAVNLAFRFCFNKVFVRRRITRIRTPESFKLLRNYYDFSHPVRARYAQNAYHFARFLRFSQGSACIPTTRNLKNVMKGYEFLACPSGQGASRAARNPSISLGFIRFREGRRIPRFHVQKHQFRLCFNKGFVKAALA